jgi:hypothetical protein
VTEAFRALVLTSVALGLTLGLISYKAINLKTSSPDRIVLELRLAQFSALLLALASGVYVGFSVIYEGTAGTGFDIALATGFFVVAALATTCEPTRALTVIAIAWGAHCLVDLAHIANVLPSSIVPAWYSTACAIYDVVIAGTCYIPVLRKQPKNNQPEI